MRFLVFLALLGLVLEVIAFGSPYWAVFKFPHFDDGKLMGLGGTLAGITYRSLPYPPKKYSSLYFGMWQVESCGNIPEGEKNNFTDWYEKLTRKCFVHGYNDREIEQPDIMAESMEPIKQMYRHIGASEDLGLTEYQAETSIGLGAALVGFVSCVIYTQSKYRLNCIGVISCLCFLHSGLLYWIAVGKIHTTLTQLGALIKVFQMVPVIIRIAWCLPIGGIAASLELIAGILTIIILFRNCPEDEEEEEERNNDDITSVASIQTPATEVKIHNVLPE